MIWLAAALVLWFLLACRAQRRHAQALRSERESLDRQLDAYLDWRRHAAARS